MTPRCLLEQGNQFALGTEAVRFRHKNPRPASATARSTRLPGSGVAVGTTAMPSGPLRPEISAAFTKPPEVVYSDTVLPSALVMYRFAPSVAMPTGPFSPEIKAAFTILPEVVYLPTVPETKFETKMFDPRMRISSGLLNPVINEAFTKPPVSVYSE